MSALRLGAHAGAPLQTVSFSYFYERNLVSTGSRETCEPGLRLAPRALSGAVGGVKPLTVAENCGVGITP